MPWTGGPSGLVDRSIRPAGAHRATGWPWRALARIGFDVRQEEAGLVGSLFGYCVLLGAFQFAAKSVRQSSFVDSLGFERLPIVYVVVALFAYPVLRGYSRAAARAPLERLISWTTLVVVATLLIFWSLYAYPWPWVSFVFYIWISIVTLLLFSQFWSWAGQLLHPRQARRLFGLVLSGGLLGGVIGGQVARWSSLFLETRATLLASTLLLLGTLVFVRRIHSGNKTLAYATNTMPRPEPKVEATRGDFATIRQSPHLLAVAGLMFVSIIVAQFIDLQFNWVVQQSTDLLDQRTRLFGNLFSLSALVALVVQLVVTSRVHRVLGVGFALRVLPVCMGLGTMLVLFSAAVLPSLLVAAVAGLKVGEGALRYSLDQGTRELLYVPVPLNIRPRIKAYIDVLVQRFAKAGAGVLLLSVTFGWVSPVQTGWAVLVLVAAWLALTIIVRKNYVAIFREGLLARRIDPDERLDPSDVTTLEVLVSSLGSADSGEVLHSLDLLTSQGRGRLVPPLLLLHDDPLVRRRTLALLSDLGRRDARSLVERLVADNDPDVRVDAVRTLATLTDTDISALMVPRLRDPDKRVRAAAIVCLLQIENEPELSERAQGALAGMLRDADPKTREAAAQALGSIGGADSHAGLLHLLSDSDLEVLRAAIASALQQIERDGVNYLFVPVLTSLLRKRRLKHEVRNALVASGEAVIPALAHFMTDPREFYWIRRALPKTIARIGGEAAKNALIESLPTDDAFLNGKIIASLASLHDQDPSLRFDRHVVERHAIEETRLYLRAFSRLIPISRPGELSVRGIRLRWRSQRPPTLLQELLMDRLSDHSANLFALLSMVESRHERLTAFEQLKSSDTRMRGHALEYLDNSLPPSIRRHTLAVVDDIPSDKRLAEAQRLFHISHGEKQDIVRNLIQGARDSDAVGLWLGAAALSFVHEEEIRGLTPLVESVARGPADPLLEETARWVLSISNTSHA